MMEFTLSRNDWAYLHAIQHWGEHSMTPVGMQGVYGRVDDDDNEYCYISEGQEGFPRHIRDVECGSFYSPNVFVFGISREGVVPKSLPFEYAEAFVQKFWGYQTQRCKLLGGFTWKTPRWDNALRYTPVERQPPWNQVAERLKSSFEPEGGELVYDNPKFKTVYFDSTPPFLRALTKT